MLVKLPFEVSDWSGQPCEDPNCRLYYSSTLGLTKWTGWPDSNYSWEGTRLAHEREVTDEEGKKRTVKTYKKPFEIIGDFRPETKVSLASPGISRAVRKRLGSGLKGFVWLDNISGGGEVVLPFIAPHIFIAKGDKSNPEIIEIGTNPSEDNYYEVIEGKTYVYVKNFSGVGGAGERLTSSLIAHYKMNEKKVGDGAELVVGGAFTNWPGDNPEHWNVVGEVGDDPEVSEAAAGESHADTPTPGGGMCNIYTSDGALVRIQQNLDLVVGRKYCISINIDTKTVGALILSIGTAGIDYAVAFTSTGIHTATFVAVTGAITKLELKRSGITDVTFTDMSVKLCAVEDSSGNDHDGLAQQDTSVIHRVGKVGTGAFDFTPNDYITIADHVDFSPGDGSTGTPFSIFVWGFIHGATHFDIACKGIYNTNGEWVFHINASDYLLFRAFDESVEDCFIGQISDDVLTAYEGSWVQLGVTYDGGKLSSGIKLYVNDNIIASTANQNNNGSFVAVENDLGGVVKLGTDGTNFADGLMDTMTFHNKVLRPWEVRQLCMGRLGTEVLNMRRWGSWR